MKHPAARGVTLFIAALALAAAPASAAPRDARALYNAKCALCHGRDGKSNRALAAAKVRNFADPDWQRQRSDDELRRVIEAGKEGTLMRAFKDELDAREITGLIEVIRAFAPAPPKSDASDK